MRFIAVAGWKDLTRIMRDPLSVAGWLAIPLAIMALMSLAFGGGGPAPQGILLVADQDKTLVSAALTGIFSRDPLRKLVLVEQVNYAEGRKRLDQGNASSLLLIPKGFTTSFFLSKPAKLTLINNPAQRFLPGIIHQALSTALEGGFYLQQFAGKDLATYASIPPTDQDVVRTALALNQATRQLALYMSPPLIDLHINAVNAKQKPVSFAALFYPGMLMLAVFGLAQSLSEDLWRERSFGTLRRLITSSRGIGQFLGGKILAFALVFALVGSVGIGLAAFTFSTAVLNAGWAVLWLACAGVTLYLLTALLISFSAEQRAASILNFFILFVLSMVGGSFFPFEMMPPWLAAIGHFTPNGWAIVRFKEIVVGSVPPVRLAEGFAGLLAVAGTAFFIVTRRLRGWAVD